jgi:molybdopterin-binding protein
MSAVGRSSEKPPQQKISSTLSAKALKKVELKSGYQVLVLLRTTEVKKRVSVLGWIL